MKPFNLIFLVVFLLLAGVGVLIFATFQGKGTEAIGTVSIWGPLPASMVRNQLESLRLSRKDFEHVTYTEVAPESFIPKLVEAIAASRGPDLVIFPAAYLSQHSDKLQDIPYSMIGRRDFQDTFIEAGEIFLTDNGFKGFPYIVDPLVLYWNRTLFTDAGIAAPPRYWDEVTDLNSKLTKADKNGSLTQSTVALGSWDNVLYAKGILLSLLRELGNPVVVQGSETVSILSSTNAGQVSPAQSAFRFYTQFSDPTKPSYSWNRSQPSSRSAFLAGRLAMYIGAASELFSLREANPNLNFDIAPLPSARGAGSATSAELYALSVPRGSQNPKGAALAAFVMSGTDGQRILGQVARLPSVRRELLVVSPADPYGEIFRTAALSAFAFFDPDPAGSEAVFKRAVENISSGKLTVADAVNSADSELRALITVRQ
jgi:ABC-type glycerol-3-phosphate transport system substrate-binding protein